MLALLPVLTMAVIGNQQIFNAYLVWAEKTANFVFFGKKMPTTWLITLDSILSVSFLAGAVVFWRLWSKKSCESGARCRAALHALQFLPDSPDVARPPAMEAGVSDHVRSLDEVIALLH